MNRIFEVCLVTVALATNLAPASHAQSPALQKGISVQMPSTSHAVAMPEADNEDAWIVTVTADGSMYFGTDPFTATSLADEMKKRPRKREQNLYVKADARAPYGDVEKALAAARVDLFETSVLLTSNADSSEGTIVSPTGLEVQLIPPTGLQPTEVQLINSGQQTPILKINNRQIPLANLQNTLTQIFQNRSEKVVLVKADGQLPFADVAHVVDACHSAAAKVVLPTPQM
jgi:biopolymer transport protein ExbD